MAYILHNFDDPLRYLGPLPHRNSNLGGKNHKCKGWASYYGTELLR